MHNYISLLGLGNFISCSQSAKMFYEDGIQMIKFIIIDDEPYVTSLFSTILDWKSFDFELVGTFSSGNEAMIWLEQHECDVIFTDICMPDMTGTEIAMHCYRNSPQILIVFFSAHRNFDYALDAI